MVEISWSEKSRKDLKEIEEYISKDSARYAENQIKRIIDRTEVLFYSLYSGRMIPELQKKDYRELIEGNYRIMYRVKSTTKAEIITVFHGRRNFTAEIIKQE